MPIYELQCKHCMRIYEVIMKLSVKDDFDEGKIRKKCPNCKHKLNPRMPTPMFKISV